MALFKLFLIFLISVTPDTSWYGIYLMGNKVGYQSVVISPQDAGYKIDEHMVMQLKMLGAQKTVLLYTTCETNGNFELKSANFEMLTEDQRVKGVVKVVKDSLFIDYITGKGSAITKRLGISGPLFTETTLRFLLERKKVKTLSFSLIDIPTATLQDASCEMIFDGKGETRYSLKYQGMTSTIYLTNGRFEREEAQMGITIKREPKEKALEKQGEIDITDLYAVRPNQKIRAKNYLRLKLIGNLKGLNLHFGPQRVVSFGDNYAVLEIKNEPINCGSEEIPDSVRKYLESDPYVQSDAPEIRELARYITKGIKDPCQKVLAINRWLKVNIQKAPSVTIPTAVEVLRERKGDCNEHAVLFTALARASGIPTDIVAGLIYQDGAYYYHAWAMVFIGNKWIFVDPIFDEFPASLAHLALIRGTIERQGDILQVVGDLKIQVEQQR